MVHVTKRHSYASKMVTHYSLGCKRLSAALMSSSGATQAVLTLPSFILEIRIWESVSTMTQLSWLVFAAIQGRASSKALLSARKDLVSPCLAVHQPYTSFLPFQTPLPPPPTTKQSPVSCDSSVGTSRFNYRLPLLTNNPTDFAPLLAAHNIVFEPSWCWPRACPQFLPLPKCSMLWQFSVLLVVLRPTVWLNSAGGFQ